MKRCVVLAGLMVFLLLIFVLAGCEMLDLDFTMDFDYRTTVETSGDIIQEIRLEITGISGDLLEEADFTNELEQSGWDVDTDSTDDSFIVYATGSYVLDEDGNISQVEGGPEVPEGFSVRVENGLFSKKYFAELDAAEGGGELTGEGGEFGVLAEHMLEDMFNFSWTITLPGEIVDSNADTEEGGSATWDFDYDSLTSELYLTVQSQYTNWPVIGGIIAGGVVVLALVVFFVIKWRRRSSVSFTSDIVD